MRFCMLQMDPECIPGCCCLVERLLKVCILLQNYNLVLH